MLSAQARSLLGVPQNTQLPCELEALYDGFFAGRSYETRFGSGWSFSPRGSRVEEGLDFCLSHRTAQMHFCLDSELRVFTIVSDLVQIASSFISLVEEDAVLVGSEATGKGRRGLGTFPSFEAFFAEHGDYVEGWSQAPFTDGLLSRFLIGPRSVIGLGRYYSDEYLICAIEYY